MSAQLSTCFHLIFIIASRIGKAQPFKIFGVEGLHVEESQIFPKYIAKAPGPFDACILARCIRNYSSAGAMDTLSAACQRTCRSRPSSTGQPCTQCRCRSDARR